MKNFAIGFTTFILAVLTIFAITVHAQDKAVKPKTPPVLTDAQKLAYFKANSDALLAQRQVENTPAYQESQAKQKILGAAVQSIVDTCGKDFHVALSASGDPECVVNPDTDKPAEPKK